jgi:hypothetical protein
MLHFTCDLCGCPLNEQRYVVKLEVFPAFDPDALTEQDVDSDHLSDLADELQDVEISGEFEPADTGAKYYRFDLCQRCRDKYIQEPLPREPVRRPKFSQN